jgi:hypothetical protein
MSEQDVSPDPHANGDRATSEPTPPVPAPRCNPHASVPRPVVRLAADSEARLLAVELTGAEIQVFETQCWTIVASLSGVHPQFVGRELGFAGMSAIHRWEPEHGTVSTIYEGLSPTRSTHVFVLRSFDDLLIEDPPGTIVRWQGEPGKRFKASPRELCTFGYLGDDAVHAVSWAKQQTIWSLDSGALLERTRKYDYSGCSSAVASDSGVIAIADWRGNVWLGDGPGELAKPRFELDGHVTSLSWDGERLLMTVMTEQSTAELYGWETGDSKPRLLATGPELLDATLVTDSFVVRRVPREPLVELPIHLDIIPKREWW